jgi:site-specific recombinase XerD
MATRRETEDLLRRTGELLSVRSYSRRTIDTYLRWIARFLRANPGAQIQRLARADVERFLEGLTRRSLSPKSKNQASSALAFLFREVLGRDELRGMPRAKEPRRIPSVLSHRQATLVLGQLSGKYRLLASLMYGAGLRLGEAHQLRVKDLDFDLMQISVRDGKGSKDRWVILPERRSTRATAVAGRDGRDSRTPSPARTRRRATSWAGSTSFRRASGLGTHSQGGRGDGT